MVVNIKLAGRFDIDRSTDTVLRRTWGGWDPAVSDEDLWDHNRGRYRFSTRVDSERYASLSYGGTIRLVAAIAGPAEYAPKPDQDGDYWALVGRVLPSTHPVSEALVGQPDQTVRGIRYLPDPDVADRSPDGSGGVGHAFLLTHNPTQWDYTPEELAARIDATADGYLVEDRWSTGNRIQGIEPGDRAFMLKQVVDPRGIVASGTFISSIYPDGHWLGGGGSANYADVEWDVFLDPDDPLPFESLLKELPGQNWIPQASGNQIRPEVVEALEQLWADHAQRQASPPASGTPTTTVRVTRQGWMHDHELRTRVENAAQDQLMQHYRNLDYEVKDMRHGNSFDARATKGDEVLYLEAKGTVASGGSVIVSRGEVRWAREHPGECILGVLSDVRFTDDGEVDPSGGTFRLYEWFPDDDELEARDYDWTPDSVKAL